MTMPEASRGEHQPMNAAALLASLTGLSPSAAARALPPLTSAV